MQKKVINFLKIKKSSAINWDSEKQKRIINLYKIDNQKIDLKYKLSLRKYNYTL